MLVLPVPPVLTPLSTELVTIFLNNLSLPCHYYDRLFQVKPDSPPFYLTQHTDEHVSPNHNQS